MRVSTNVTIRDIPLHPTVRIMNENVDTSVTWGNLLKHHGVKLDPTLFVVYNKSRKLHGRLFEPISKMLSSFTRQASLTVVVVKLREPLPLTADLTPAAAVTRNGTRAASHSQSPTRRTNQQQQQSRFPEATFRIPGGENSRLPPRLYAYNEDDAASMLSVDEDDDGSGDVIKEQFRRALDRTPGHHFAAMKHELTQLKSGEGRDYKWSHYAPKTAMFILSAMKL